MRQVLVALVMVAGLAVNVSAQDTMAHFAGMARVYCPGSLLPAYAAVFSEDLTDPAFVNRWHVLLSVPEGSAPCLAPTTCYGVQVGGCAMAQGYSLEVAPLGLRIELLTGDPNLWPMFSAVGGACEYRTQDVFIKGKRSAGVRYYELRVEERP